METPSKVTYFQRLDSHDFPIGKEGYPNKEILLSWNKEYLKAKLFDLSTLLKKEMGEKAKQDLIHLLSSISQKESRLSWLRRYLIAVVRILI